MSAPHPRLRGLDGVRALSVGMVIATHAGLYGPYGFAYEDPRGPARLVSLVHGITGVSVFFVLSGYLITTLLLEEQRRYGHIDRVAFYARRFLRIMPVYFVFLLVLFGLNRAGLIPLSRSALVYAGLYATNFVHRVDYYGELGHTWSLAVEEHYYLVWPLLLSIAPFKWVRVLVALMLGASVALYLGFTFTTPLRAEYFTEYWTMPAAMGILVGSGLALLRGAPTGPPAWLRDAPTWVLGLGVVLYAAPLWWPTPWLKMVLFPLDLGVALLLHQLLESKDSRLVNFLELRPLRYLGTISYGLYLWQGLFLRTGPNDSTLWFQQPPINGLLVLPVAIVSYHAVEKPFLRLKARFAR